MSTVWYALVLAVIAAAIGYIAWNFFHIRKMPEGTAEMQEMADIIRSGANTFMKTEYRTIRYEQDNSNTWRTFVFCRNNCKWRI